METLYVYDDPNSIAEKGEDISCYDNRMPLMLNGYYGVGYHINPVKVGEIAKLIFNSTPVTDGHDLRVETVRIISIRFQYWNGDNDHDTNPSLEKYILKQTEPSFKNWVRVQFISEERDNKLNQLGIE